MTRRIKRQSGFALVLVMGIVLMLSIIGALTTYLVQRAQRISSGLMRYNSAQEAADASMDYAAEWLATTSRDLNLDEYTNTQNIGRYTVTTTGQKLSMATLAGGDLSMHEGYSGTGTANKGAARYFVINARAVLMGTTPGLEKEVGRVEVTRRDVIGD